MASNENAGNAEDSKPVENTGSEGNGVGMEDKRTNSPPGSPEQEISGDENGNEPEQENGPLNQSSERFEDPPETGQEEGDKGEGAKKVDDISFILDVPLKISVELGQTTMLISEMLKLGQGSIIPLSKTAGDHLEVLANQKLIARGEVVVVDKKYAIRVTEIVSHVERIEKLR